MLIEIACFDYQSALTAGQNGAARIELCENYSIGGVTPTRILIEKVKSQLRIPVYVMIRPRGGDFIYSPEEFETMKRDIEFCKRKNVEGLVFGILNPDATVHKARTRELVHLALPMAVTFHRAFDETPNPSRALEDIIECGCTRILTSGQKSTAIEGTALISELITKAAGRIILMPGGGVRSANIAELKKATGATEFHSSDVSLPLARF